MICNSGSAFVARAGGRRLTFEEEGIYNGVFVMRDRETGTLWSHYTGEAFEGPLLGTTLDWVQTDRARFDRLKEQWPDATLPVRNAMRMRPTPPASDRARAMGPGLPPAFEPTMPESRDRRLRPHEHGLGVFAGGAHRFYPLDLLGSEAVVNDEVGGAPVVVLVQDGSEAAAAYSRCVGDELRTFEAAKWEGRAALRDVETKSIWTAQGEAVRGSSKGQRLTPVRALVTDWYGWWAYFPKTTVRGPESP